MLAECWDAPALARCVHYVVADRRVLLALRPLHTHLRF